MKGLLKSGCISIGAMLIICLSLLKAYCYSYPHTKGVSFARRFVMGDTMVENSWI